MTATTQPGTNLGFLTVLREPAGFVGGYLVTNLWGRPLEFRLSSSVLPNKVQQILYGPILEPYLFSDLIGKKLVEKTSAPVQFIFTDQPACLDLRLHLAIPVALVKDGAGESVTCHASFDQDAAAFRELFDRLGGFDLSDPFLRIREALAEARKLGVTNRAA